MLIKNSSHLLTSAKTSYKQHITIISKEERLLSGQIFDGAIALFFSILSELFPQTSTAIQTSANLIWLKMLSYREGCHKNIQSTKEQSRS